MKGRKSQYIKKMQEYDFKKLAKNQKDLQIKICLLAMNQIKNGKTICDVAKMFNVHFNSVRAWIKRFIDGGVENLIRKKGQGRKKLLTKEQAFKQAVMELKKYKKTIKGKDVLKLLQEKFGVKCCLSSVYVYLRRANIEIK